MRRLNLRDQQTKFYHNESTYIMTVGHVSSLSTGGARLKRQEVRAPRAAL